MKNKYCGSTHLSERKFLKILECFCLDLSSTQTAQLCKVNKNTAHRFYQLFRKRVIELAKQENKPFTGEVEIDESYFGAKRIRGKRGRGAGGKQPVIGLLKRDGKVYVKPVESCSRKDLLPIIKGQVLEEATIYTDGWRAYDCLVTEGYEHFRIHHHRNQFARGKNHVNGIESFWSFAKIRMAKKRGIRKYMFLDHLLESQWRWNYRKADLFTTIKLNILNNPL